MPFTDHSDLYGAVHDEGINRVVRHIMRQRPSLFNYATPVFHQRPELFCQKIDVADKVTKAGNPIFTEQEPLPIFGTPVPMGLNFCVQFTDFQIDFHPTDQFELPPELGSKLQPQRMAVRARACAGLDCPPKELIDELVPILERLNVAQRKLFVDEIGGDDKEKRAAAAQRISSGTQDAPVASIQRRVSVAAPNVTTGITTVPPRGRDVFVLPTRELMCFCLEVYAVAHFEWGTVPGFEGQWLKPRVDGIEIVDIAPTPMENAIECFVMTTLRLGILPRLIVPMEKMVLDVTAMLQEQGLNVGQQITLEPAAVPGDVPNNPAIEQNEIRAFINLNVS
ncbi:MAG: hypothetical protein IT320_07850 [Anaerolineae bacterium]|nr:hypothetical protein [Anaerolineae bacterium]